MINQKRVEPSGSFSKLLFSVVGCGVGAFCLADNFFGRNSIQLSPGDKLSLFGWQFYVGTLFILVGIFAWFLFRKSKKDSVVVKNISKKKSNSKKRR